MKHAVVSRKLNQLHEEVQNTAPTISVSVQLRLLEELKNSQKNIMEQIIELLPEDVESDFENDDKFLSVYSTLATTLENKSSTNASATPITNVPPVHHLAIPMPTFDGTYEQWPKFKSMFSDIMKRTAESDAIKLYHLNKALVGKAVGILNASIMASNNFATAWNILEERYENPRLIVDKHIAGLLQLKPVPKESAKGLRELVEACRCHVDGLKFMKKPIDNTTSLIITHVVAACLDTETRKLWEQTLKQGEFPELEATLEFIYKQSEVLERCSRDRGEKFIKPKPANSNYTSSINNCAICNKEQHGVNKCSTFLAMPIKLRKQKIKELNRCFNCLGAGHSCLKCASKWRCVTCNGKHHSLLHESVNNPPAPSAVNVVASECQPSNSPASQIVLTASSKVKTTVLLSTVLLNVVDRFGNDHQARALLDSGAQSNFIAGRLDATSILMRFRTHQVALTADVAKMYRQVWVHPCDRTLQRILWRAAPNEPIEEYELKTVTYGTAAAPFLAVRSLQQTVEDHGSEFPMAATRSADFYVDDFVSGAESTSAAQQLQHQTEHLYAKGGFELRKWASNETAVLQCVDQQKLASSPYATSATEGFLATLGLIWDPVSDTLQFKIHAPYVVETVTKRRVLSCIARIYDPLGIVDPVKAMAKQFLQRIWTLQTDQQQPWGWDDELPPLLQGEWINFQNQLIHLQRLHIPRVAIAPTSTSRQFHFFCDASEKGYGACCYVRSQDPQGKITMQLFASKTKVTPIRSKHSIARLELCAAQLASLLYDRVKAAVDLQTPPTFWTDSTTVVHWLRASPNCWKPFVANRVSQVQHLTRGSVWRHIAGVDNPADLASRGCLSKDLLDNPLWWQGPSWMHLAEDKWPESRVSSSCESAVMEQRIFTVACAVIEKPHHEIFTLYSSFSKLRRIVAYWKYTGIGLTTQDLKEAEEVLCRLAQQDCFKTEIKVLRRQEAVPSSSKLKWLHPHLGIDGII
uniref:Peptidase aspartic putative domain-containing protein n=1 Tax=Anopheles dirus TaxID=7168 RepID=A0A182N238_9DIPT